MTGLMITGAGTFVMGRRITLSSLGEGNNGSLQFAALYIDWCLRQFLGVKVIKPLVLFSFYKDC